MRKEYIFSLVLYIASLPSGYLASVAPDHIAFLKGHPDFGWYGSIGIAVLLVAAAIFIAIRGEWGAERQGANKRMIPLIAALLIGTGLIAGGAWYLWIAEKSECSKPAGELGNYAAIFESTTNGYTDRLGDKTDCLRMVPRSSIAQFEHAFEVWLFAPKRFFIFPSFQSSWESFNENIECGNDFRCTDANTYTRQDYFERLFHQKTPTELYPPFGATANLLIERPEKFKELGWMIWDCEMYTSTFYQKFQRGEAFGIFKSSWFDESGKIWILYHDAVGKNTGTYDVIGTVSAGTPCDASKSFPVKRR